ncbi:MAG: DUF4041 domain-containing protein [Nostoc sp. S4]|nr:DUF4041 domain-containing protein [Nostoc sp. S4]
MVLVAGLIAALTQALVAESRLAKKLHKYDTLIDKERYEQQLESNIHLLEEQQNFLNTEIGNLQQQFNEIDAKFYLQSIDSYEPKYDFISSTDYILRLKNIKSQQERMRENNQAYICDTKWSLGESKREGKKMINDLLKLIEFAFETQCKEAIKDVRYNNIDSLKKKINNSFDKINKFLRKIDCKISTEYLQFKLIELDIQYELEDKKQQEREREQEFKKQIKEREAIEKARHKAEEAEQRERLHQQDLDRVKQEIEQAKGEKLKQLELQIQELERQIAKDKIDKENALSESRKLKSGYIYIISNIGSLGRDVYRICITSRNKEDEYIRDMNPAVPYQFDVHFKIFSEDAWDTLQRLHQRFENKKINLVNSRRDFFKVSMDEIEQVVKEIQKKTGVLRVDVFEPAPQAYEYRQTLAARKKHQQINPDDSYLNEDVIA